MGSKESLRENFKKINILACSSQYIYQNIMSKYKNRYFISLSDSPPSMPQII